MRRPPGLPTLVAASCVWLAVPSPARAQGADTTARALPDTGAAGRARTDTAGGGTRSCTLVLFPGSDSTRMVSHRVGPDQYVTHVGGGLRWTCGSARMVADSGIKYDREDELRMIGSVDYRDSVRTLTSDSLTYWQDEDRIVAYGRVRLVRLASKSVLSGPRIEFFRSGGGRQRTVATGRPHLTVRDTTGKGPAAEFDADRMVFLGEEEARMSGHVRIERGKTRARADSAVYLARAHEGRLLGSPEVTSEDFRLGGNVISAVIDSGHVRSIRSRGGAEASGQSFRLFADGIDARVADEKIDRLWAHGQRPALALSPPYRLDGDSLVFAFRGGDIDSLISIGSSSAVEVGDTIADTLGAASRGSPPPPEAGEQNWVRGDTLQLAFARPDTGTTADSTGAPADTTTRRSAAAPEPGAGATAGAGADTAAAVDTTAIGDTGSASAGRRRQLRQIRAAGSARAYYLVPRDSADGGGKAKNYLVGREIVVFFANGDAQRVEGRQSIGVFLDPTPPGSSPTVPADTTTGAEGGGT